MSSDELGRLVNSENASSVLLIDCRPFSAFQEGRVLKSINAHVPKLLRRRSKGPMKLENILTCSESREKLRNGLISTIVVYDEMSEAVPERETNDDLTSILECFIQQPQSYLTTEICYLDGGFNKFAREFPARCDFRQPTSSSPPTLFRLQPLQVPCNRPSMNETPTASFCQAMSKRRPCLPRLSIQPPESYSTSTCSTNSFIEPRIPAGHGECQSVPTRRVKDEPVSILPHLYLGSAFHSGCDNTLQKLGITAVLNVSKRCPNHFPQSLTYKNIPVDDDTDADLSEWFHEAASFIDSVKANEGRVLVHCKAGISRSATICMAYLMISRRYRLDEAFEYVHLRRTIISPNLHSCYNYNASKLTSLARLPPMTSTSLTRNSSPVVESCAVSPSRPRVFLISALVQTRYRRTL
ncbi:putative dual specificity protein phosphatase 1-B-like [Apostichopus japonicus]|uniref:protein-tyrosine-phosphatase n=1 Tax=Stichopus japonicus TaxID=307972 RepID=A0A2G8KWQ8_STIJA|nr:putative dual specificity protein phosphatase 1-B-like [Apostichopus japonicus]